MDYSELSFTNDFVFCSVLRRNKSLCMELIGLLLDIRVKDIRYINSQQTIEAGDDSRGIRLDVYVEGDDTVFDLEMQTTFDPGLAKRCRYYQSLIDQGLIHKGEDYQELRRSYVVFICLSDPFRSNLSQYHFRKACKEMPGLFLDDGAETVFFNASGNRAGISRDLSNFLDYLMTGKAVDPLTDSIEEDVRKTTGSAEWRKEYMTLAMRDRDNQRIGREQGLAEGRQEGRQEGRMEAIQQLVRAGLITLEDAAKALGVSVKELQITTD